MIFEKLQDAIAEQFSVKKDAIELDTSFSGDLGADSLDIVELVAFIEEEFDVPTPDDDTLAAMETVGDVVDYISKYTD